MIPFLAASLLLQINGQSVVRPSVGQTPQERVTAAELKFFSMWADQWRASESNRAPGIFASMALVQTEPKDLRYADLDCYWDPNWGPLPAPTYDGYVGTDPIKRKIGSRKNYYHWVCPSWVQDTPGIDTLISQDERLNIDNALDPEMRATVRRQRRSLIANVRTESQHLPKDSMLIGQLVRLLLDNEDMQGALNAARGCGASESWCKALLGYVHHRMGNIEAADSAFAASKRAQPKNAQCRINDVEILLDGNGRAVYGSRTCAEKDSLADVVWWLADPMWSAPGNDRRTEQLARQITIALHAATGRDERYNWMHEGGGDAIEQMVLRYGWPAYTYTGGRMMRMRFPPPKPPVYGYIQLYQPAPKTKPLVTADMKARALGGLRSTYEYTYGRLHMIPEWSMVTNPFAIRNEDWSFNGPARGTEEGAKWWPQEHYAPLHEVMGIHDEQTAFLRRSNRTLFAYATNLGQVDLARRVGDPVEGHLMVSTGPASIVDAARRSTRSNDVLTLLGEVPEGKSLVSAEVAWDAEGHRGARARFGITAPASLASMQPGEYAISDPVLLVAPVDLAELPNLADSAIMLMRGSTTMSAQTSAIGIYWETYGFAAQDSVEIAISVQRHGNVLNRITNAAGITGDPNALVSTSWKEPQPGHSARTIPGAVPIQMRAVTLGMPGMQPGDYTLQISVKKSGRDAVTSKRDFTLK